MSLRRGLVIGAAAGAAGTYGAVTAAAVRELDRQM
jgi:hypothetical protein